MCSVLRLRCRNGWNCADFFFRFYFFFRLYFSSKRIYIYFFFFAINNSKRLLQHYRLVYWLITNSTRELTMLVRSRRWRRQWVKHTRAVRRRRRKEKKKKVGIPKRRWTFRLPPPTRIGMPIFLCTRHTTTKIEDNILYFIIYGYTTRGCVRVFYDTEPQRIVM